MSFLPTKAQPTIGMFDSGVGGITVLKEVLHLLPEIPCIYFGDTARCPYGPKGKDTITRYSLESAEFLQKLHVDALVIACHTVSSVAIDALQKNFTLPILGVVEPAVDAACAATLNKRIGVIGTQATIQSGVYQQKIAERLEGCSVFAQSCPLFVPLIETECKNNEIIRLAVKEHLEVLKMKDIDTLLLGCTHYPLLQKYIEEEFNHEVIIINPAKTCAFALQKLLRIKNTPRSDSINVDGTRFFVSDDPERFKAIGSRFLHAPIQHVETVTLPYLQEALLL